MPEIETEPGHESPLLFEPDPVLPGHEGVHLDGSTCQVPASRSFDPFNWWYDYRASLMTRSYLYATGDIEPTDWQRLRLSLELFAITAIFGLFWTAVVFAGLVLITAVL